MVVAYCVCMCIDFGLSVPLSYLCICLQVGADETATEETGDSGMGTGPRVTKYGTIEELKEGIQNPPPGMCIALECFEG